MTTPKSLPVRPSQDSLRKQAKKLAREIAASNADAVAREEDGGLFVSAVALCHPDRVHWSSVRPAWEVNAA